MPEPVVARAPDEEERLSLYPLTFEEALKAALAVDPRKSDPEEGAADERTP